MFRSTAIATALVACLAGAVLWDLDWRFKEPPPKLLAPGAEVQQGGGRTLYSIDLDQGQRLRCTLHQDNLDVGVEVFDPLGERIAFMDLSTGAWGVEEVVVIAQRGGRYTLAVDAPFGNETEGSYLLQVGAPTGASFPDDLYLLEASRQLSRALYERPPNSYQSASSKTLERLRRAQRLARLGGSQRLELMTMGVLGQFLFFNDDPQGAFDAFRQVSGLCRTIQSPRCEANAALNTARILQNLGRMQEAIETYWRASDLAANGPNPEPLQAAALQDLGMLLAKLGDLDNAVERIRQASALTSSTGLPTAQGEQTMGQILLKGGQWQAAVEHFHAALSLWEHPDQRIPYATTLLALAEGYLLLDDPLKAEQPALEALAIFREAENSLGILRAEIYRGRALQQQGRAKEAFRVFRLVLRKAEALSNPQWITEALYYLASVRHDLGDFAGAMPWMERALESISAGIPTGQIPELQELQSASLKPIYELAIDLHMHLHEAAPERGHDRDAFSLSQQARCRALLSLLSLGPETRYASATPEERARLAALHHEIRGLITRMTYSRSDDEHHQGQLDQLLFQYRTLEQKILQAHPKIHASQTEAHPLKAEDLQDLWLDEDTVILDFTLGKERSFLWALSIDSFQTFHLPGREEIERQARESYTLLTAPGNHPPGEGAAERQERLKRARQDFPRIARELSATLLGDFLTEEEDRRLLIVAEGALLYLPFSALPDPRDPLESGAYRPLLLRHEIGYLPTAALIPRLREHGPWRLPPRPSLALVIDPVYNLWDERLTAKAGTVIAAATPGLLRGPSVGSEPSIRQPIDLNSLQRLEATRLEGQGLQQIAPPGSSVTVLEGFSASLEGLRSDLEEPRQVLHVAAHGVMDDRQPELSGLVLSRFDDTGHAIDGFLSLHDIYNLNLDIDLVTLSACRTALGKEMEGEGLIGLTRGFMLAGAPRVLASLWQVDDRATADLMTQFYQRLLQEGLPPLQALRQAQEELWHRSGPEAQPYYWAAFTLQGDWL